MSSAPEPYETGSIHEVQPSDLGALVTRALNRSSMTQTELSDRIGCTQRHLRRIRAGQYATREYVWKALEVLGWKPRIAVTVPEREETKHVLEDTSA